MAKDYNHLTQELSSTLATMHKDMPGVMTAFSQLAKSASAEGALDLKTKELIALAIGIACRCDGCIGFHSKKLVQTGASREELQEMLAMAVFMGGGPSLMYAAEALNAFEQFSSKVASAA
ncbi:MAG: carboxymuconolactone decarboxylase family protein [Motiliproteus sp.]